MNITLQRLKNAVKDIKSEWYEGNLIAIAKQMLKYNGACESLDMLVTHFQELDDFTKWKKEKRNGNNVMKPVKRDEMKWHGGRGHFDCLCENYKYQTKLEDDRIKQSLLSMNQRRCNVAKHKKRYY